MRYGDDNESDSENLISIKYIIKYDHWSHMKEFSCHKI